MIHSFDCFSSRLRLIGPVILMIFVSGCGYAEYEARLAESRKYYAYLDKIEQSLAPKWIGEYNAVELRVPRQFNLIPPPQAIKNENGELEFPAIDPRQPDYWNLIFPGLFGAWESPFNVAKTDGSTEEHKGYIYVLSNYKELAGDHAVDAGAFVDTLKTYLTETLRIQVSDERKESHPKVLPAYQPQSTFDVCAFKGKDIGGVKYTFEVYSRAQGSVICAIVIVLPEGMDSPQKVSERIPMMLESFTFTKIPPKAGSGAGGGAPAQQNPRAPQF